MKNQFENQVERNMLLEDAYQKAQALDNPIKMEDFSDLYKDAEKDLKYVEEMEMRFRQNQKEKTEIEVMFRKIAKIFEVIVSQQIELSNWLGESAITIQASRYDDIHNGVDTIVEFDEESGPSHLALAIDVTSSHEIRKKFDKIKGEIDQGFLTEIKYFMSENLSFRGHKSNVPRVVIGADKGTILDLTEKWLDKDQKALAKHIIQTIIIEEIVSQLEAFIEYAESINKFEVAKIYQKTLSILEKIKAEKDVSEDMLFKANEDQVLFEIKDILSYFKKQ